MVPWGGQKVGAWTAGLGLQLVATEPWAQLLLPLAQLGEEKKKKKEEGSGQALLNSPLQPLRLGQGQVLEMVHRVWGTYSCSCWTWVF